MPLGWHRLLVKRQPLIPVLLEHLPSYSSQAVLWEMMAPASAMPTQFSFPLCHSFPAVSNKSYIATNHTLNIQFVPFCQPGVVSCTCAKVLASSLKAYICKSLPENRLAAAFSIGLVLPHERLVKLSALLVL